MGVKPVTRVALPALSSAQRRGLIVFGVIVAAVVWTIVVALAEPYDWSRIGTGHDARPYWTALFETPYATSRVGAHDAYLYSPAFLQMIAPLRQLPWQLFLACWTLLLLGATLYIVGPLLFGPVILLALPEILGGNITLLIAAAVVAGFRFSGTWAFPLLTKVTPGVGLLWFLVRREWRAFAIAMITTAGVVVLSFLYTPAGEWFGWFRVLADNSGAPITSGSLPVPLFVRLPLAVLIIAWGAWTGRRWTVPVATLLALPVIWYGSLSLLVAVLPLAYPHLTAWSWRESVDAFRAAIGSGKRYRGTQSA
jgi:hypothetical protein